MVSLLKRTRSIKLIRNKIHFIWLNERNVHLLDGNCTHACVYFTRFELISVALILFHIISHYKYQGIWSLLSEPGNFRYDVSLHSSRYDYGIFKVLIEYLLQRNDRRLLWYEFDITKKEHIPQFLYTRYKY